jgi:hypothetical protein
MLWATLQPPSTPRCSKKPFGSCVGLSLLDYVLLDVCLLFCLVSHCLQCLEQQGLECTNSSRPPPPRVSSSVLCGIRPVTPLIHPFLLAPGVATPTPWLHLPSVKSQPNLPLILPGHWVNASFMQPRAHTVLGRKGCSPRKQHKADWADCSMGSEDPRIPKKPDVL